MTILYKGQFFTTLDSPKGMQQLYLAMLQAKQSQE